jgi:hypothetical protein
MIFLSYFLTLFPIELLVQKFFLGPFLDFKLACGGTLDRSFFKF